jgi:hypothetical protein
MKIDTAVAVQLNRNQYTQIQRIKTVIRDKNRVAVF